MHKLTNKVIAVLAAGVLALIGSLMSSREAAAQQQGPPDGLAVRIVNPLPVPTTGTVGLAPGATVVIGNAAAAPVLVRDVDNPARTPFQAKLCPVNCTGNLAFPTSLIVPAGKQLVIEQIAGECFPSGQTLAVGLTVTTHSTTVTHLFGLQYPLGPGFSTAYTNHTTRLYADGGTTVAPAYNSYDANPADTACDIAFSGYLTAP